ncbi:repulsive guidance molecule A [Lingula anatina]|uniref:Repulsive guidance molecule A n=1 Tax=Lingula anatina TaxID=7574 RepID=A0A1S3HWE2_LINAN|nr:repulsive guidance molecule A [Lingula anatina]|eukprot:XP_013389379.1 repulsive guidance molecule A [Lingula anatina]
MGAWCPMPSIGCLLLLGLLACTARTTGESCATEGCWNLYMAAQQVLGDGAGKYSQREARCVQLRTYFVCVKNITGAACSGNIQFYSVREMVERQMKGYNCSEKGDVFKGGVKPPVTPPITPAKVCSYNGERVYRHCGLFGDPHLRTFDNDYQTCKVQGAWPLIDNDYLTVQVTNDPVVKDGSATATSKLTVVIKSDDRIEECGPSQYVLYQAQTNYLPATFDDGRWHFGVEKSVQILEKDPGKHVEIYVRYIDTTIVVRQIGRYFTFSLRMPEELVNRTRENNQDGLNLCLQGCPLSERINYKKYLATKRGRLKSEQSTSDTKNGFAMSREDAINKCRTSNVVDFYFDSCVFDLMTTGDTNFSLAADVALQDVSRLYPESRKTQKNRTDLAEYDKVYSSSPSTDSRTFLQFRTFLSFALSLWIIFTTHEFNFVR